MKRILLILFLLALVPVVNFAQDADENEAEAVDSMHFKYFGIRYAFEENKKSLYVDVNYNEETPTQVNIMRQIKIDGKFYPVKRIGARAFYGCRNITCVTIPDNVEFIDSSAFRWCVNLSNIGISSNVKRIGPDCFRNCTNLRNFHIPNNLQVISPGAFRASGLMTLVLPEGLKEVGAYAFEGCKALAAVQFQKVVFTKVMESTIKTFVSADAFAECKSLTDVICNTGRTGKVKDVLFHENAFRDSKFNYENIMYGGKPIVDPNVTKRKKGEPEFEEDEVVVNEDAATRLRTSETVKRARKNIGVRKNTKKKKR